ncbi:MAG: tetratricopeptide repeat protein, partial [Acidobacteriota bacterium]|nr:tetratricopeptide repeat protein [Acidobacteriota bacterium]
YAEARTTLTQVWNQASAFDPLDLRLGLSAFSLAAVLSVQGDLLQAEALLQKAKAIFEAAGTMARDKLASTLDGIGLIRLEQGSFQESESLFQRALELNIQAHGAGDPWSAVNQRHLAELYLVMGKTSEAENAFRKAIASLRTRDATNPPSLASALEGLARICMMSGRLGEAERLINESLESKRHLAAEHPSRADSWMSLAILRRLQGDAARAEPLLRKALAIYEKSGDTHSASALAELAGIACEQKKLVIAERYMRQVLTLLEKQLGPDHGSVATASNWLANVYVAERKYSQAKVLAERSLAIQRAFYGANHPKVAETLALLASIDSKVSEAAAADSRSTKSTKRS